MNIPEALKYRIDLYRNSARVAFQAQELFAEPNWLSVFVGQWIIPRRYDPLADVLAMESVNSQMQRLKMLIRQTAKAMPSPCRIHRGTLPSGRIAAQRLGRMLDNS